MKLIFDCLSLDELATSWIILIFITKRNFMNNNKSQKKVKFNLKDSIVTMWWCLLKVLQMSFHLKTLLTLKTDLIRMTSIGSASSCDVNNWRQKPWQFVYICFGCCCGCCCWLGNQLLILPPVIEHWRNN